MIARELSAVIARQRAGAAAVRTSLFSGLDGSGRVLSGRGASARIIFAFGIAEFSWLIEAR